MVVNKPEPEEDFEAIVEREKELLLEAIKQEIINANGRLVKRLVASEITHGRKNTTHHFIRLIRFAIKLMMEE